MLACFSGLSRVHPGVAQLRSGLTALLATAEFARLMSAGAQRSRLRRASPLVQLVLLSVAALVLLPVCNCFVCRMQQATPAPTTSSGGSDTVASLKRVLTRSVVGLDRGIRGSPAANKSVLGIVGELEAVNPTPEPCSGFDTRASKVAGTWVLLFSNAPDVTLLGGLPGVEIGKIRQIINDAGTEILNTIELRPALTPFMGPFAGTASEARICLEGTVESGVRIARKVKGVQLRPLQLGGMDMSFAPPLKAMFPAFAQRTGWFDTTYVDDDLWIITASDGSKYVSLREAM